VSGRRRTSLPRKRSIAYDLPSKSFELEQRISRLEVANRELHELLKAIRVQVDYIAAKVRF